MGAGSLANSCASHDPRAENADQRCANPLEKCYITADFDQLDCFVRMKTSLDFFGTPTTGKCFEGRCWSRKCCFQYS